MNPVFDHERLEVYQVSIDFVSWVGDLIDGPLSSCRISAVGQLDRASTSIPLNIAEGNGKRTTKDRCRYLDTSRGSAFECAASLDALVARRKLSEADVRPGKKRLLSIVRMLTKLIQRLDPSALQKRVGGGGGGGVGGGGVGDGVGVGAGAGVGAGRRGGRR